MIKQLENMLAQGQDTALLRFSLGNAYLGAGTAEEAVPHLERAVELDPDYSAAWKLLGRALADCGRAHDAVAAFDHGIAVAEQRGDVQAAKEMNVFRKRAIKALPTSGSQG